MPERLSVALCITELDVGGAERCLVRLATRMDRERFTPVVYVLAPPPVADRVCLVALEEAGVEVHFLGMRSKSQLPLAVWRLARCLRRQRPAVVQSFLFHANIVARLASRLARVPAVVSGIRVAERRSRWPLRVDRWTDRLVDRHVCVSQSVAEFAESQVGLPRSKLVVIPNGVDLDEYSTLTPADLGPDRVPPERRLVTYVGRLDPQKGLSWLLQTAPSWLSEVPDCDLLLVGQGSQRDELEQAARTAGIAPRVHFLGFRREIPAILARSDLFVLPSIWEGMPNAVLEAMAAGLPIVATDVEGVAELLGPNCEPQMAAYGDTKAFSQKVTCLLTDRDLAERLGHANRQRAEEHFSTEAMVRAYESLWTDLSPAAARRPEIARNQALSKPHP
jgi:glycosyltransferase involved in cell wall biosynthesis